MRGNCQTGFTLERIAIDHGIELLLLRNQYYLVAKFEAGLLAGFRLDVSNRELLSQLQSLLHIRCAVEVRDDAVLIIAFENGKAIEVRPDERYEAWELVSSIGERWICMPGGELAIWSANSSG